ncbi:MAG: hypothetical protein ACE15C_15620 [Phycisphaerae bacterium]
MERVFFDANVLFSAAYKADCELRELWRLADVELVSAEFIVDEARRNLAVKRPSALPDMHGLVQQVKLVAPQSDDLPLEIGLALPPEDMRAFRACVFGRCTVLLTGDRNHFQTLMENPSMGVRVALPGAYLRERRRQTR